MQAPPWLAMDCGANRIAQSRPGYLEHCRPYALLVEQKRRNKDSGPKFNLARRAAVPALRAFIPIVALVDAASPCFGTLRNVHSMKRLHFARFASPFTCLEITLNFLSAFFSSARVSSSRAATSPKPSSFANSRADP
jgi:hypothetical protein